MQFRRIRRWSQSAGAVTLAVLICYARASAEEPAGPSPAVTPSPRSDAWWTQRHEKINARARGGGVDLVFLGDSITQGWESTGTDVWQEFYGRRDAANMGISGDQTQHVLWRLDHENIDGISPKVVVVMIGTNNSNGDEFTAQEIGDGVKAIVMTLRDRLPETHVLLLGIFPRGEHPNPQREKIAVVNEIIARLADGKRVRYLDIGERFLTGDGTITKEIMPDFLHLSPAGYAIWAQAIEPLLSELLGEKAPGSDQIGTDPANE